MIWGGRDLTKLGTLPTAVLSILNEGPANVSVITMGSGASRNSDGILEAEVIKRLFIEKFDGLDEFPAINAHSQWLEDKEVIRDLVKNSIADIASQNTVEELTQASTLFEQHRVARVIEITGASHGPRCQLMQSVARASGVITASQRWQLVTDDIAYYGTEVGDTLVFEEPHRGGDPIMNILAELHPAKLFRQFFAIPKDDQAAFLEESAQLFKKYVN